MQETNKNYPKDSQGDNDFIDIKRYLIIIYHKKWTLALFVAFFTLLAVAYSLLQAPTYESNFSIYYKQLINASDPGSYNTENNSKTDPEYWMKIMLGSELKELTQKKAGIRIQRTGFNKLFRVNIASQNPNLYNIKVTTRYPEQIPVLSNAFVNSLNNIEKQNNIKRLSNLLDYLKQQLEENQKKLKKANEDIAKFSQFLNVDEITDREQLKEIHNNYKKKLKDLNIRLATKAAERMETENEFTQLKDTLFYETSFSEPLKLQLMNLKIELAKALTKYKEEHPTVLRIKANIEKVNTLLNKGIDQNVEIKNLSANPIKRDLLGKLARLKIEEKSLIAERDATTEIIESFNKQISNNQKNEGIYQKINKKEQLLTSINMLNKKIIDTETFLQGSTNNFIIIDPAQIPMGKSNKPLILLVILGIMAGAFFGVAYIIVMDLLDNRIKLISDIENLYNINILGRILHKKRSHDIKELVNLSPDELSKNYYKELTEIRININQLIRDSKRNIISVISPFRREGKTTSSFLVAHEFARTGKNILLIDIDTYYPKLTNYMGFSQQKGLQDFLLKDEKLEECIHKTKYPNIDIISAGNNEFENQIFYDNKKFDYLLEQVSQKYDKVILDTPGLLFFPEIISLVKKVDYTIVVIRLNKTTKHKLNSLLKKIKSLSVDLLGTIITDVRTAPFSEEQYYYSNKYYSPKEKISHRIKSEKSKIVKQEK